MDEYLIPLFPLRDSGPVVAFGSPLLLFFPLRLIFISSAHSILLALEAETASKTSWSPPWRVAARHPHGMQLTHTV